MREQLLGQSYSRGPFDPSPAACCAQASGGNASPANLAFGISKALVHTMLGLMLAVPCLAAFGFLRTMVDKYTVRASLIAEELLLMIKPSEARPMPANTIRPGAVPQPAPQAPMAPRKPPSPIPVPGAEM